jgi:hypothetical protein
MFIQVINRVIAKKHPWCQEPGSVSSIYHAIVVNQLVIC